jgi:hypothetical protein
MSNNDIIICPHCKRAFFDTGANICPFCHKGLNDGLQVFKDLFRDNNPFDDNLGVT